MWKSGHSSHLTFQCAPPAALPQGVPAVRWRGGEGCARAASEGRPRPVGERGWGVCACRVGRARLPCVFVCVCALRPSVCASLTTCAAPPPALTRPLSSELSNICLLVASVASGKQVAGFGFVATGNASKLTNGVPRSDKLSAGLMAPSPDPEPSISSEQQKAIGDDGTPEVVINFHATGDDPSGTVAACQEAFKTYCVNHLQLGAACSGPRARAVPAAYPTQKFKPRTSESRQLLHLLLTPSGLPRPGSYSKCTKDSDCKAYATGAKGFTLTCNDDNHCVPSYNNLREIRFMASGDTGAAPQTCETLVQGAGAKYTEIGDFQKKNFGQPKTNTINYMTPSNTGMFVNAKLCGIQSDSPPDPPICDILLGSGPSAAGVEKAMQGKGLAPFGFEEIPASFAGDGGTGAIEQSFNAYGMFLSQLGMGGYWEGVLEYIRNDNCRYVKLYTTSIGCNLPQMPAGKEMTCLKFVKTKLHHTPHGLGHKSQPDGRPTLPHTHQGAAWHK